jgi:hypothetical protein
MAKPEPCRSCGATLQADRIDVSVLGRRKPMTIPGRKECPNGCDPAFPRVVLAHDLRRFLAFVHDRRMDPRRVIFVPVDDPSAALAALRGQRRLSGDMVDVAGGEPGREIVAEIWSRLRDGDTWLYT